MFLSCQQICALAAAEAKGPGFLQQAGQYLNMVLEDLVLNRNLKMNRVTQSIVLPANSYGPFNLESDYLRTYDMFYPMPSQLTVAGFYGLTMFINPSTMKQFDAEFKDPSQANYPYEFATDLSPKASGSPALLYIFPQSSGQLTITHRYMLQRAAITSPETNSAQPWFEYTDYLVTATAARVMKLTGDDRRESFEKSAEKMLQPYLIMEGDEQETVHNIQLDPRRFKPSLRLRATKSYPF